MGEARYKTTVTRNSVWRFGVVVTIAVLAVDLTMADSECCMVNKIYHPWSFAVQKCRSANQRLINLKTIEQNNAILKTITSNYHKFWIGIYKSDKGITRGKYIYAKNVSTPITWSAWGTGQPNNDKDCVFVQRVRGLLKWFTDNCNAMYFYVCEPHNNTEFVTTTSTYASTTRTRETTQSSTKRPPVSEEFLTTITLANKTIRITSPEDHELPTSLGSFTTTTSQQPMSEKGISQNERDVSVETLTTMHDGVATQEASTTLTVAGAGEEAASMTFTQTTHETTTSATPEVTATSKAITPRDTMTKTAKDTTTITTTTTTTTSKDTTRTTDATTATPKPIEYVERVATYFSYSSTLNDRRETVTPAYTGDMASEATIQADSTALVWDTWTPWTACTKSCEVGRQMRIKLCSYHNDTECSAQLKTDINLNIGYGVMWRDCNVQPCPQDGAWAAWGEWSVCSATCGQGTQRRTRSCVGRLHGGKKCAGARRESVLCEVATCPAVRMKPVVREEPFKKADGRASAIGVGVIGIVCIALAATAIIALDVVNFVMRVARRKVHRFAGTYKASTPPTTPSSLASETGTAN